MKEIWPTMAQYSVWMATSTTAGESCFERQTTLINLCCSVVVHVDQLVLQCCCVVKELVSSQSFESECYLKSMSKR
eukprot:1393360-Rhodomonas_salina.2